MLNWAGDVYIVTVNYHHSGFLELDKLNDITYNGHHRETESSLRKAWRPNTLVSDKATQYVSAPFKAFTRKWCFTHETFNHSNSQANGAAEAAVEIKGKCSFYIGQYSVR